MNRHFAAAGFALLGGWSMVSAASADALEDYSFYRIAGGLDDVCHVLKFVERDTIDRLAEEKLGETSQHALMLDGRMSQDEYDVWRDAVHADASAKASEIGCTPAAQSYLLAVRGIATGRLYQDLMLAFHFHGLAEDDVYRIALSPEQISAASGFDGFVKQLYGESFPQFRENQRQAALARMPYIGGSDPLAPEFDVLNNYAEALNPENIEKLSAAAEASSWAVKLIHFEVAAETAGYRVWPLTIQEHWRGAALMEVKSGQLAAEVFDRRFTYELGEGGQVYGVLGMSPEGRLRFLTYGTAANDKLRNGAVRLLVRTAPAPAELTGYGIWQQPDWRTLATAYDGVLLPQDCIGGPCFEFPDAALEAIRAIGFEEDAELWLSGDPASVPPATSKSYLRNAVYLSMLRRTMGEVPAVD